MIIKQLDLPKQYHQSFQVRRDYAPKHHQIWHYHEELEFVHIVDGSGTLFIGDRIKAIQPGETVLIPSQTPHYWLFDTFQDQEEEMESINCIVLHFKKNLGIENLLAMPELQAIKQLIDQGDRGYYINKTNRKLIKNHFEQVLNASNLDKLISLFKLLECIQDSPKEMLTSENYAMLHQSEDQHRMNNLMDYIRENYKQPIKLVDLASLAGLTENSFCRYFKQKTGKTPVQFITELRVSHACTQLRNSKMTLKEICYDSGFNNFVSFHKNFKSILGLTPLQFRQQ
ncbi:AraC family transcriptional regulator [Sphingobacterium lactis]|uniref:AraC family transcriptional regulator n=1 Tax=Sphingobacterium lactis TaxID=797291 RepID=UPI003F7F8817